MFKTSQKNFMLETNEYHSSEFIQYADFNLKWRMQGKVMHLLNNYLSSIFTFVDFARKSVKQLITSSSLLSL